MTYTYTAEQVHKAAHRNAVEAYRRARREGTHEQALTAAMVEHANEYASTARAIREGAEHIEPAEATVGAREEVITACERIDKAARIVERRQEIERKVIRKAVQACIAAGYTVSHHDGEAYTVKRSSKVTEIVAELHACDEEVLVIHNGESGARIGEIVLVYGNDGWDVIADYSTILEPVLAEVNAYADKQPA